MPNNVANLIIANSCLTIKRSYKEKEKVLKTIEELFIASTILEIGA
jgi:hypothetical protein